MEKDNLKIIKKIFIFLLLLLCAFNYSIVKAADEYLPITYKTVRYTGGSNTGTTIWYSIIPKKYKMHYAYGLDKIGKQETPSTNAVRHKATLAVNTQYMGLVDHNGTTLGKYDNVSQYDFYLKPNDSDNVSTVDHLDDATPNMYAVSPTSTNVGIDLRLVKDPGKWCKGMCFNTLIRNGVRDYTDENNYLNGLGPGEEDKLVDKSNPRTWIAIDSQDNQFVAVCAGRGEPLNGNDFSLTQEGLTYEEIIAATKEYFTTDIKYLFNLDGGGSSSFVYKGNMLNPKYDPYGAYTDEREVHGIFYWKVDNYNITYNLNGGTIPSNKANPTKFNIDTATITLNNPTKEGYTFTGWTGSNGQIPQKTVSITPDETNIGNKTYVANWEKEASTHTISFDSNGGSDVEEITFTDDGHIIEPTTPKKDGYKFVGWYEDKNFTKKFDFSKLPTSDITLYAKWEKVSTNGSNNGNVEESIVDIPNTGIKGPLAVTITIGLALILAGGTIVYKNTKVKENKMQ